VKLAISRRGVARACACGLALLFAAVTAQSADPQEDPAAAADRHLALLDKAKREGTVRVIVELAGTEREVATAGRAAALANVQNLVLQELTSAVDVDPDSVKLFDIVPGMALAVDSVGLQLLLENLEVTAVEEDKLNAPALYDSIPLIDADLGWNMGYRGAGQTVAILDTGVNKNHPFLNSGKVISEACYSSNGSCGFGCTAVSLCPGGATSSTATGSGLDCALAIPGCGHGTHVAGIAAGSGGASNVGTIHGVAPDAKIIAVKVFTEIRSSAACSPSSSPCALAYTSDMIKGLERVYALRNSYAIASANMSIGGGRNFSTCDSDSRKAIIDTLRGAGIATVIASGNDGWSDSTSAPGCISTAITVGSTTKGDVESFFSNSASWLDVLAPGSSICSSANDSAGCGGSTGAGYGFKSGTSMATPHVAGAWAVMKSKNGTASVSAVESALESTGVSVSVGPAGNKPRIDLDNALAALSPSLNIGLNWDHCLQTWRLIGDSRTWCYLEGNRVWVWANDNEGEESLIEATAGNHWVGIYVNAISGTSFSWSHIRVYKF
jgi:subtilisin family serine protease